MLKPLQSELFPFLLPNTCGEAPRAVSVLVNQLWLGTFLSWTQAAWNSPCLFILASKTRWPRADSCLSAGPGLCWLLGCSASCLGKVLVGTGQIHTTDCSNSSLVQTLVLQCLGIVPAKLVFNCRLCTSGVTSISPVSYVVEGNHYSTK